MLDDRAMYPSVLAQLKCLPNCIVAPCLFNFRKHRSLWDIFPALVFEFPSFLVCCAFPTSPDKSPSALAAFPLHRRMISDINFRPFSDFLSDIDLVGFEDMDIRVSLPRSSSALCIW